jgi:fatty-acyl-CoA synthase
MKLAFTTLGCLDWDLETIVSKADEYDFDGVDFRGYRNEMNIGKLPEFTSGLAATVAMFKEAGLEVPCFSTSARVLPPDDSDIDSQVSEVANYACICEAFGAKMMRIFGGRFGSLSREEALSTAAANLGKLAEPLENRDIKLMLETHDDWLEAPLLRDLMQRVDSEKVGILWDVHHPYRMKGEAPEATWDNLGKWIGYTHFKDSRIDTDTKRGYRLCLPGEGDIPLKEILAILKAGGYDGYLTFEWERAWHPEIEPPDQAFPRYSSVMREILGQL